MSNEDPSAFLFSAFSIIERIHGYPNKEAKQNRQQAIDNIAACSDFSDEEKRTLLQLYYDTCPGNARRTMSEEEAKQRQPAIETAITKFNDHISSVRVEGLGRLTKMYDELVTDVKWLIEMNFFIAFELSDQLKKRVIPEKKSN